MRQGAGRVKHLQVQELWLQEGGKKRREHNENPKGATPRRHDDPPLAAKGK